MWDYYKAIKVKLLSKKRISQIRPISLISHCLTDEITSLCHYLQDERNALMLACENGQTEIVKCLIDAKAQLNLQTKASID